MKYKNHQCYPTHDKAAICLFKKIYIVTSIWER